MSSNIAVAIEYEGQVWASWEVRDLPQYFSGTSYTAGVDFSGGYQPRVGQGLLGVSASVDILHNTGFYYSGIYSSTAGATSSLAIYGTDSTRTAASLLDPDLIASGAGVEPMIDIQASATSGSFLEDQCVPSPGGSCEVISPTLRITDGVGTADGRVKVDHRIILNPEITIPEAILGDVTSQLNNVPLQVLWEYDVSGFGLGGAHLWLSVTSEKTGDCTSGVGGRCGGFQFLNIPLNSQNSGSIPFTAVATREGRNAIYEIEARLRGFASTVDGSPAQSEIQAVYDPLLIVDPSWEYAQYFSVQQESTLNPDEWVGITRDYLNTVPVPAAIWLFGSGLIGLIGVARRKKT
jgi:hypothetical protein